MNIRKIQTLSIILAVLSIVLFGYYVVKQRRETDYIGPVIHMNSEVVEMSIEDDPQLLLEGVSAQDSKDGDVTDSLVIENLSKFVESGKRFVSYAAFDKDNNVSKAKREVVYTDYWSPKYSIKQPFRFAAGKSDFLEFVKVKDCLDGDLTGNIKMSPEFTISADKPGDYPMELIVTNSAGDTAKLPVTFEIYNPSDSYVTPQIELKKYIVYVKLGKSLKLKDNLKKVTIGALTYKVVDGAGTYGGKTNSPKPTIGRSKIKISDDAVDYDKEGVYEVVYSMKSSEGKVGKVRLIVVVRK